MYIAPDQPYLIPQDKLHWTITVANYLAACRARVYRQWTPPHQTRRRYSKPRKMSMLVSVSLVLTPYILYCLYTGFVQNKYTPQSHFIVTHVPTADEQRSVRTRQFSWVQQLIDNNWLLFCFCINCQPTLARIHANEFVCTHYWWSNDFLDHNIIIIMCMIEAIVNNLVTRWKQPC